MSLEVVAVQVGLLVTHMKFIVRPAVDQLDIPRNNMAQVYRVERSILLSVGAAISNYCTNGQNSVFLSQIGGLGHGGIAATGAASQAGGAGGTASGGDINTNGTQGSTGSWVAAGGTGKGASGHTINGVQYGFGGSCTASGSPTSGSGCVIIELIYWN